MVFLNLNERIPEHPQHALHELGEGWENVAQRFSQPGIQVSCEQLCLSIRMSASRRQDACPPDPAMWLALSRSSANAKLMEVEATEGV